MSNHTDILDNILYGESRPWLEHNGFDEQYASKFRTFKEYESKFNLQFEIDFYRPTDFKTKYYSKLIRNTVKADFDRMYELIKKDENENVVAYWLNDTLDKRLKSRLTDIGELIKQKDFDPSYINPKNTAHQLDLVHKANTYVMQLLKLGYMQLYLEIQEAFKDWVKDEFIIEDFYSQLLHEPIPEKLPITRKVVIEIEPIPERKSKQKKNSEAVQFESFYYKQYPTNPVKLNDLCDSLKLNNFIHADTPLSTFKKVFSGTKINDPVIWTGNKSELYYFIKLIHNELKLVEDLKQSQWRVACLCFVDENNGTYEFDKLRKLKRPALTAHKIETAVNHLK